MRSSPSFLNFLELQNAQHNGSPCAHFGSPTRFHPLTAILRACSRWGVRVTLSNARWLGAHGELTRPYISGLSPAKSEHAEMHQLLSQAKKRPPERLLSTAESQRTCDASHSRNPPCAAFPCSLRIADECTIRELSDSDPNRDVRYGPSTGTPLLLKM